jgi:transitional endoplasmic reticulum ATPase
MCRLIVGMPSLQVFLSDKSIESLQVRKFLDIRPLEQVLSRGAVVKQVEMRRRHVGNQELDGNSPLGRNIAHLGRLATLTGLEMQLLAFVVLLTFEEPLRSLMSDISSCTRERVQELFGIALNVSGDRVREALRPEAALADLELLKVDPETQHALCKFRLMDGFAERMVEDHASDRGLFGHFFSEAPPATLGADAFRHLNDDLLLVTSYVRGAIDANQPGANVLVHGIPGSGKTEFARLVAAYLGLTLYQVEAGQHWAPRTERLGAYKLCQRFLAGRRDCLVLFDEVEDVFPTGWDFDGKKAGKAKLNQLLESNRVPSLWISNAVQHIDEAHLRRFDYSVSFPCLPRDVRHRILLGVLQEREDCRQLMEVLEPEAEVTPGFVRRTVRMIEAGDRIGLEAAGTAKRVLQQWRAVKGIPQPLPPRCAFTTAELSAIINASSDIAALANALRCADTGIAVLFYGPPGTGKTALVHALAAEVGKALVERRPSNLLGAYVGENEANVAAAFASAETSGSVLFLDEVDALLAARTTEAQRWELSLVTELLTAIEGFKGVLICATNQLGALDPAVLRRFTLKVKFDYLDQPRAQRLLARVMERLGIVDGMSDAIEQLLRLPPVSIGDFAAVERRAKVCRDEVRTPKDFVRLLAGEVALRDTPRHPVGFHPIK